MRGSLQLSRYPKMSLGTPFVCLRDSMPLCAVVCDDSAKEFKDGVVLGRHLHEDIRVAGYIVGSVVFLFGLVHTIIGVRM